jgi:hypothetical protein
MRPLVPEDTKVKLHSLAALVDEVVATLQQGGADSLAPDALRECDG